ncbi:hypothetical protein Tco_1281079 [Tanacetum coccineum]
MVKNLEGGVKLLIYPRFVQVFLDKQVGDMTTHNRTYDAPYHTKKIFANMKREGKGFSRRVTPLFQTMMVQAHEEGEGSTIPTDPQHIPTITQPSTSQPQKKQPRRKQRKGTEVSQPSGPTAPIADETDNEKMFDLENAKTAQDSVIASLKKRVKKLEKKKRSITPVLKRLRKVGRNARIESSDDASLGDQEDASKQERKIADIDDDVEVTLIDETRGRNDEDLMFDTGVLDEHKVEVEKVVSTAEVTTASATTTTVDELTLAQTLIEIKEAKPKAVTTAATKTTTSVTRPKARGVIVQEPSDFTTTTSSSQPSQLPQAKDKGKAKMIEPEKPLKKKDHIIKEDANIAEWDDVQAMMDADYEVAARLQAEEQGELTVEEKSKLFAELINKRKKHFARLRAEEQRRKPPTKAQKRNTISKRAGEELESENLKKQKLDKNIEAKVDDDQEEAKMKKHMEIVLDEEEVAVDAIPLATKPSIIVDWKIIKEGQMGYFQIIRADGSLKRYSSMIQMLQSIDREDLETLWKLVKAKHGNTRPEEGYERVLWGDLEVMFEPDVESEVWRNLQGYKVTVWKLFDSCGVHFMRFQNLHIFMLVEKRYPLTPATITDMLNKKLQIDQWNEMSYQLLKLIAKQLKNP